ncbi:unnamed protein product, partial [Penicillium salamii]
MSGNNFFERDSIPFFDIYKKYLPERFRFSKNLLKKATLDSKINRQCLKDIVIICTSTECIVYYFGIAPEEGCCLICNKSILEAKHILQCRRKSLNGLQYQQRYKNEKHAHRYNYCKCYLDNLNPRYGHLTFR